MINALCFSAVPPRDVMTKQLPSKATHPRPHEHLTAMCADCCSTCAAHGDPQIPGARACNTLLNSKATASATIHSANMAGILAQNQFWHKKALSQVYSPPSVDRIWGIWGSYYNIPKNIFALLRGDYTCRVHAPRYSMPGDILSRLTTEECWAPNTKAQAETPQDLPNKKAYRV